MKRLLCAVMLAAAVSGALALSEPATPGPCGPKPGERRGICQPPRCPVCTQPVCDPAHNHACPWSCVPIPDCVP